MAAGHYQFEAIHPFTDGNGRTGRVLNLFYLVEQGLLDIPVLHLSRHILPNKADSYIGLQSITDTGVWEPWLLYMITGVTETARWTMNKMVAVRGLLEETAERMRRDARSGDTTRSPSLAQPRKWVCRQRWRSRGQETAPMRGSSSTDVCPPAMPVESEPHSSAAPVPAIVS